MPTPNQTNLIPIYHEKGAKGVWDRGSDKELEFYIAGYTHRQEDHKALYDRVAAHQKGEYHDEKIFPLPREEYKITLKPEPTNQYDPNALQILISFKTGPKEVLLGYVPREVAFHIKKEMGRISDIALYKSRSAYLKRGYYSHKIVIGYDGKDFKGPPPMVNLDRFAHIED